MQTRVLALCGAVAVADDPAQRAAEVEVQCVHEVLHAAQCVTATDFGWISCQTGQQDVVHVHEYCLIDETVSSYSLQVPRELTADGGVSISSIHRTGSHVIIVIDGSKLAVFPVSSQGHGERLPTEATGVHLLAGQVVDCSNSNSSFYCCTATGRLYNVHDHDPGLLKEVCFPANERICQVRCSDHHSMALTHLGGVFTWGNPAYGRLGVCDDVSGLIPSEGLIAEPRKVETLDGTGSMQADGTFNGIKLIACGLWHCIAVSHLDDVFSWGWNTDGALGLQQDRVPLEQVQDLPQRMTILDTLLGEDITVLQVCCSATLTAIITSQSQLLVFGRLGFPEDAKDNPILQGVDIWPSIMHHFVGKQLADLVLTAGRWHLLIAVSSN